MGEVVDLNDRKSPPEPKRRKLTKSAVDKLEFDPDGTSNQVWWDTELTGFGVRLNPGGSKTFLVQYRNEAGKLKRISLGKFGSQLTAAQARRIARETIADVIRGADPLAERKAARRAPDKLSFDEIAQWYLDEYAKPRKKSWETDQARLFPKDTSAPMYVFHNVRPGEHSREEVEDSLELLHTRLRGTPVEANRVVQLVGAVFNYAVKKRKVSGQFKNIVERIDLFEESKREEWIRPAELPGLVEGTKLLAAPKSRFGTSWAPAIWFTLLTGARLKSETLQLQWHDVHFDVGEFTFRETKNGNDHTLPMTRTLRALLEAQGSGRPSHYVFGRDDDPSSPRVDSRSAFAKLRKTGSFRDHITPHALRHTTATYIQSYLHMPEGMNRAILNHSDDGITSTYAHSSIEALRDALEKLDSFVRESAGECPWFPGLDQESEEHGNAEDMADQTAADSQ